MHEFLHEIHGKDFSSLPLSNDGKLDHNYWTPAGVPLGGDNFWMYQDRNANISFPGDMIQINIDRFSLTHDEVQILDNPKHLYLTKENFLVGRTSKLAFSCLMKSHILNGNYQDYRDGFGSFNVLDFKSGMVFDIISNGAQLWLIYERLLIPGVVDEKDAFTHVLPINRPTHKDELIQCSILFEEESSTAKYYVDFDLIYESPRIPVEVQTLQGGFGFITLRAIENGKSISCQGQGGEGLWGDFRVYSY